MAAMKLLVDVGNSRVKWAFGTADGFVRLGEAWHQEGEGPRALLEADQVPAEIRIANVAGSRVGTRLAALLEARFRVAPVFARSAASGAGVRSGYTDPSQLGVDRWLAICAAFARYRAPLCVVDAGTATTIDIVNGAGEHEGGLILPGIALMQAALRGSTGDLDRLSAESATPGGLAAGPADSRTRERSPVIDLGRNTAAALHHGAIQSTAGLIHQCLRSLRSSIPPGGLPERLVLTGGSGPLVGAAVLREPGVRFEHRPHLVLEGLALDPACFQAAP